MSKRSLEDEFDRIVKKLKKFEKRIRNNQTTVQPGLSEPDPGEGPSSRPPDDEYTSSTPPLWGSGLDSPEESDHDILDIQPLTAENDPPLQEQIPDDNLTTGQNVLDSKPSSQPADTDANVEVQGTSESIELDDDVLEILGSDPTSTLKHGPDTRKELASRLQHIATEGLSKENRKELIAKYLIPANCLHVGAPALNPEIKAALTENIVKRDKGIESKQKEMASAISCLTDVISLHLNSKEKNNQVLQKLVDIGRLLCDMQHGDSVTRRNFILFAVKSDMQEHLKNTKIDTSLFGENLSDTLKSAKAVNKSGADLKLPDATKNQPKKSKPSSSQPLNRKAAAAQRRPAGAASMPRSRATPTASRPTYPAPHPPAPAYRTSSTQQPPPPPPPPRRRY